MGMPIDYERITVHTRGNSPTGANSTIPCYTFGMSSLDYQSSKASRHTKSDSWSLILLSDGQPIHLVRDRLLWKHQRIHLLDSIHCYMLDCQGSCALCMASICWLALVVPIHLQPNQWSRRTLYSRHFQGASVLSGHPSANESKQLTPPFRSVRQAFTCHQETTDRDQT